jgi:hypothetical protein
MAMYELLKKYPEYLSKYNKMAWHIFPLTI